MKVVILAGGFGTRLGEETVTVPKPMVQIGQHPMLWHIMKFYASYGFEEFVVALGYKAEVVKNFFLQFADMASDLTINLAAGTVERRRRHQERWTVHLIDTGLDTLTGGRVLRLAPIIDGETFMLTYGDGLSDVPLDQLLGHHRVQGKLVTVTAVSAPARFGGIAFDGDRLVGFAEKHAGSDGWINGGYMVMEPGVLDYLRDDADSLEVSVLERLSRADQLAAYKHAGFWQCMDTMRDKQALERLWGIGRAALEAMVSRVGPMPTFDQYGGNYRDVVQRAIDFAGLEYEFFVKAKARIIKQLAAEFGPAADVELLDVGCGVGALHDYLRGTFARICGADESKVSIEAAKKRHPEIEYRVMAGNQIPYPAAAFDIVTAINVLHHIDPEARRDFVLELKRVIRPNGVACIIEHNPLNPLTRLAVFRCPFDRDAHLLRAAQANRLLKAAGLAHVRASYFLLTPLSSAPAYRLERWLSALPLGAQFAAVGKRLGSDPNGLAPAGAAPPS